MSYMPILREEEKEALIRAEKDEQTFGCARTQDSGKYDLGKINYQPEFPVVLVGFEPDSIAVRFSPQAVADREAREILGKNNLDKFAD